jgi:hypothetical protein
MMGGDETMGRESFPPMVGKPAERESVWKNSRDPSLSSLSFFTL